MSYYRTRLVQQLEEGGREIWTASHPDLPGCHALGATPTLALAELDGVRQDWITRAATRGQRVPSGSQVVEYELVMDPGHAPEDVERARRAIQAASEQATSEQEQTVSLSGQLESE